jgi:hypothetical protein
LADIACALAGGNSTTLKGSIPYQSDTDTTLFVAPNTANTLKALTMTGTGVNGAPPVWTTLTYSHFSLTGGFEDNVNKTLTITAGSSDTQYPSAKAVYDELLLKQDVLESGTNIKTINSQSLVGAGDVAIGSITWRGAYSALTEYVAQDGVSYLGSSYICKSPIDGEPPTNNTYWDSIASKGDPGISGVSGAFIQPFGPATSITVTHNFNAYPVVQVLDDNNTVIIPESITHTTTMELVVVLATSDSGNVLCTIGGVNTSSKTKSGDYQILATDAYIYVTAASTQTLPSCTGIQGRTFYIKNLAESGQPVIVATLDGSTIDGELTKTLIAKYSTLVVNTDGADWFII